MLGNDWIRQSAAERRRQELWLQEREGQDWALQRLLQEGEHQLIGAHPHGDIEGLNHQPGFRVTGTTGQQARPEVPPEPVGKQLALAAAMQQCPWLGAQAIDQVLQIDAPGPRAMASGAIDA